MGTDKEIADKETYYRNRLTHTNYENNELYKGDLNYFGNTKIFN